MAIKWPSFAAWGRSPTPPYIPAVDVNFPTVNPVMPSELPPTSMRFFGAHMKLRQHGPTRGGGFFSRVGVVGPRHATVEKDISHPLTNMWPEAYAEKPRSVSLGWASEVVSVLGDSCLPQIGKPVIAAVVIDVVDQGGWPLTSDDQPDEPVSEVQGTVDANLYGPTRTNASGSLPCVSAVRLPSKDAGVWIVLQNLANAFGRKVSSCFDGHVADYPISTPVPPIHAMIGVQYDGNR